MAAGLGARGTITSSPAAQCRECYRSRAAPTTSAQSGTPTGVTRSPRVAATRHSGTHRTLSAKQSKVITRPHYPEPVQRSLWFEFGGQMFAIASLSQDARCAGFPFKEICQGRHGWLVSRLRLRTISGNYPGLPQIRASSIFPSPLRYGENVQSPVLFDRLGHGMGLN